MFHRLRIRNQLLLIATLVLLPLVTITAVSARRQWAQRRDMIYTSHEEVADAVANSLEAFLQNYADTQEAMAVAARMAIRSHKAFHAFITEVARTSPYLLGFAVIAPDGSLANSDPPPEWWQRLRDRSDLAAVRSGRRWAVSNLQRSVDGAPVVTITTSLSGTRWLLRSVIDVRGLNDLLNLPRRDGWRVMITDTGGRMVYHSLDPDRKWEDRDVHQDAGVQEALTSGSSRREGYRSPVDGEWCLASYVRHQHTGWVVGSTCPIEFAMAPVRTALIFDAVQIAAAFAVSLGLLYFLGARISRPIERLAATATAFGRGERTVWFTDNRADEVGVLGRAFNTMAAQVQERLDREHAIASTLQTAFLPQQFPASPGYSIGATYHAALPGTEVGGDFYDMFRLPNGEIGLLLGDVAGKGLTAAIYATMARYMTRAFASETSSPADAFNRLNRALCDAIEDDSVFVTAFYAILNPASRIVSYCNAGHWPALLARQKGTEVVGGHGLALGISARTLYDEGHFRLNDGDQVLLFTDGLVETGGEDPMDHLVAVQSTLERRRGEPPQQLVDRLHREAIGRSGGLRDDVALLALRCDGKAARTDANAQPRVARSEGR
jgi:serine phosphatase RsbU (regulator of sigma subunit)